MTLIQQFGRLKTLIRMITSFARCAFNTFLFLGNGSRNTHGKTERFVHLVS
jgi:hypothetical protein